MKHLAVILLFTSIIIGCKKNSGKDTCEENPNAESITHDNISREYVLYVPSSYTGSTDVPLVLNFHGFGGNASEYMDYADMRSLAELDTFILVYPQGTCQDGSPHWNPSELGGDNKSTADDFGFIEALIIELSGTYSIDTERVYACGYSNGGMFAYGLARERSSLVAAVGSISGSMLETSSTPTHPIPVINIHGTNDDVLPYNGSSDYSSVNEDLNYWVNFNNTNTSPTTNTFDDNGTTIEQSIYADGDSSVSVAHYKIINGSHIWFNNSYQGSSATKIVWDFMSAYDINGLR